MARTTEARFNHQTNKMSCYSIVMLVDFSLIEDLNNEFGVNSRQLGFNLCQGSENSIQWGLPRNIYGRGPNEHFFSSVYD